MAMENFRPTTIEGIKRIGKRIARERGIQHSEALGIAAVQAGYRNFRHAQNALSFGRSVVADTSEAVEASIRELMSLTRAGISGFDDLRRRIAGLILRAVPILQARDTYWAKINLVQAVRDLNHNLVAGNPGGMWLYPALISLQKSFAPFGTYNETYTYPEPAIKDMSFDALAALVRKELRQYI